MPHPVRQSQDGTKGLHRPRLSAITPILSAAGSHPDCRAILIKIVALYPLFALTAALRASREVGSFGVITHPIDYKIRQFYRRWGFEDVPFDPKGSMIVRMVDLGKSGIVA